MNLLLLHEFEIYFIHSRKLCYILFQIKFHFLFYKLIVDFGAFLVGPIIRFSQMLGVSFLDIHFYCRAFHKYYFHVLQHTPSDHGDRMKYAFAAHLLGGGCGTHFFMSPSRHPPAYCLLI